MSRLVGTYHHHIAVYCHRPAETAVYGTLSIQKDVLTLNRDIARLVIIIKAVGRQARRSAGNGQLGCLRPLSIRAGENIGRPNCSDHHHIAVDIHIVAEAIAGKAVGSPKLASRVEAYGRIGLGQIAGRSS